MSALDPNRLIAFLRGNGTYYGSDGGVGWQRGTNDPSSTDSTFDLSMDPFDPLRAIIQTGQFSSNARLHETRDGGVTWTELPATGLGVIDVAASAQQLDADPGESNNALNVQTITVIETDVDLDGISDTQDNCLFVANAAQRDTDGDGFGNRCDADLNNDGQTNVVDLGLLRLAFFTTNPDADLNGDQVVNVQGLGIMRSLFFTASGPSGLEL